MTISVVIGAGYGDEGKGHVVDYLSGPKTLVVRFNGGAQAGHTVVTPNGVRHVFHHFGSGTLRGAQTFLSEFFLVNPIIFLEEFQKLIGIGVHPVVHVDPEAMVTTPWDMILNQEIERARGDRRHGSCGLGIHETIHRSRTHPIKMRDVFGHSGMLMEKLEQIQSEYAVSRAETHRLPQKALDLLANPGLLAHFLADVDTFKSHLRMAPWTKEFADAYGDVVFEGAQGLMLDQQYGSHPYVTHSSTGLTNIIELLKPLGRVPEVYYVTRPYATRHGAGPLPHEELGFPLHVKDETNVEGEWQGKLRFAWLDLTELGAAIHYDLKQIPSITHTRLVVTCLDQMPDEICYFIRGMKVVGSPYQLLRDLGYEVGVQEILTCHGPTHKDLGTFIPAKKYLQVEG